MRRLLLLGLLLSQSAWSTMESSYQEGHAYTSALQEKAKAGLNQTNLQEVPGFGSANPKESALYKDGNLGGATQQSLEENEAGNVLIETAKSRQRFKIDPATDPLFQTQNEKTAEQTLNIQQERVETEQVETVERACEEGGEEITYECFENRHVVPMVPSKKITLSVNHLSFTARMGSYTTTYWTDADHPVMRSETIHRQDGWTTQLPKEITAFKKIFCPKFLPNTASNANPIDCSRIQSYTINSGSITETNGIYTIATSDRSLNITLHHDTYEGEELDEWQSTCDGLESMVDEGLCQYGERTLTQGLETRNIKGYQITKDAWQYKQVYHCKMIKDDCSALRSQGCYQISSKCKEMKQGRCWVYEQTYQCPNGKNSTSKIKSPALEAFCLTGDCHNTSYQANSDMLNVMSRLNMLKEIQDDIRAQGNQFFQIFKGNQHQCSRNCISFKDCCGGLKGWGVSLHIAGCTAEEKALAKLREQNLCHQIGTYCAKKILKKCVSKKTSFCCFGTKFSRLLQEQGRAQLGLGWGTAECPDCRGFTVEELSRMDLSKMDFRELFQEIMQRYKQPDLKSLQEKTGQRIQENIQNMQQGLDIKKPRSGVLEGHKDGL